MATPVYDKLRSIATNLWWAWQPDVWQIFREIDADLWPATNHNPIAFLDELDPEVVEQRAREGALASRVQIAHRRMCEYVEESGPHTCMEAGPLHAAPVAYFCAEFGIHESLPIYSGGLGVLAGDHMKATSDLGIPVVGIGLFYVMGYFTQTIDENGWQREVYGRTEIDQVPITKLTDESGEPLEIVVQAGDGPIKVHVWSCGVGRNRLLLLDADVEGNKEEDRKLTHTLYGGDRKIRLRQELLLGVGGVNALRALDIRPGVYHLNEGHSAFAPLELTYHYMQDEGLSFEEAKQKVSRKTVFTTHTPVPAGHDRFELGMLEETMGPLRERLGLDHRTFHGFGRVNLDDVSETFCMTVLAMKFSNYRNGVANLHGEVSRQMWHNLWPHLERQSVPIDHITNGVHVSSFLAPQMKALYDRHLEPGWEKRMDQRDAWAGLADVDNGELWETHQILKSGLIQFVKARVAGQTGPDGKGKGEVVPGSGLEEDVLTIGFARRFATYKRANLILKNLDWFREAVNSTDKPIQFIVAGKAHPADEGGKTLIQNLVKLTTDPAFNGRVVFIENYDMNVGRHLVQGVDVWLNNPRRPQEACGTSGQKVVLNGILNCSILDGWWAEAYDGKNGFAIGYGREFTDVAKQDAHDGEQLYKVLTEQVIPLYYDRDENNLPQEWIERMKWTITSLGWKFNANRMVLDYLRKAYLPAVGATQA
jgi:starch phosphorylase